MRIARASIIAACGLCVLAGPTAAQTPVYGYAIIGEFPHDSSAFTQGLVLENGTLFEGTGLYGRSSLREVELATGAVQRSVNLGSKYFGEGITVFEGRVFQLTWREQVGFIYDAATFTPLGHWVYEGEGWGLTHDSQHLIMSDGTNRIRFLDPVSLNAVRTIDVFDQGNPVIRLNELEYINDEIFANVWLTDWIVRIDPATGTVVGWIDMSGLLPPGTTADVLNGIAYDAMSGHLLVTGKFWPTLFEIAIGQPDLVSSASAVPAAAAAPGTRLTFTETTANIGQTGAEASTTRYFLSADSAYGGDIAIGSRSVIPLAPGAESVSSPSPTIPSSTPLGVYYVIACADATSTIAESDEGRNCGSSATTIDVTRQDLVTKVVSTAATAMAPGGTFTVSDTAQNQGGIASVSSTTRFYFSVDAFKSAGDRLLTGSRSVTALAPGASSSKSGTKLTVPLTTPLGFYVLMACADDTAKNIEISDANNCAAAAAPVQVGRPDLVIASLSSPPLEIAPGKTFSATAAATNRGTASSVSTKTRFYLSADATRDASDVLFSNTMTVMALTPGQTTSATQTLTVPATTPDGTYRLLACADDTSTTIELDETNNCTVAAATVKVKRADLTESAVSNPPATVLPGSTFSVTDTVINAGAIASASTITRYYLSLDTVKTVGDVLLTGTRSVPSLDPGGSSTSSKTLTVPAPASGTYYLLACADDTALVSEVREDNNCLASAAATIVP